MTDVPENSRDVGGPLPRCAVRPVGQLVPRQARGGGEEPAGALGGRGVGDDERRVEGTDREQSLSAAVLLRLAVSRTWGVPAGDVRARRSCAACGSQAHGRPSLAPRTLTLLGGADVSVSLSHTHGRVAVALGTGCRVGVDVERAGRLARRGLADRVLDPAARSSAAAAPPAALGALVDRAWTRKEALVKAAGTGARVRPTSIVLSGDHVSGWPRALDDLLSPPARARFYDLDVGPGHVASAVAVTGRGGPASMHVTCASRWVVPSGPSIS